MRQYSCCDCYKETIIYVQLFHSVPFFPLGAEDEREERWTLSFLCLYLFNCSITKWIESHRREGSLSHSSLSRLYCKGTNLYVNGTRYSCEQPSGIEFSFIVFWVGDVMKVSRRSRLRILSAVHTLWHITPFNLFS